MATLRPSLHSSEILQSEIAIPSLPVPDFPIQKFNEPFFLRFTNDDKVWVITSKFKNGVLIIYKYCCDSKEFHSVASLHIPPNYWLLYSKYLQRLIVMVRCVDIGAEHNYSLSLVDIHSGEIIKINNAKIKFPGRVKRKYMRIMEVNGYLYIFYVYKHALFNYQIKINFCPLLYQKNSRFIGMININKSYILCLNNQFNVCIEYCNIHKMFIVFVFYKWGGQVFFLKTKDDTLQDAIQVNTICSSMSLHDNIHKALYYKHGLILIVSKNHPMVYYHIKENKMYPTKCLFPNCFNLAKVHITTNQNRIMMFSINESKCLEIRNFGTASAHGNVAIINLLNIAEKDYARYVIYCIIKKDEKHHNLHVPIALQHLILQFYLEEKW